MKKRKDTIEFDKLPLDEKASRYASWFGIYNDPEWQKLKDAYMEGYNQRLKENDQQSLTIVADGEN